MWIVIIGILAALLINIGYIEDLRTELHRGSFPHWGDTLAIPLMATPFFLLLSLGWLALNSLGMKRAFKTKVSIFPFKTDNLNYWYLIILLLTVLLTILMIVAGDFWQVLAGFVWMYFYISILAGKRMAKIEKNADRND